MDSARRGVYVCVCVLCVRKKMTDELVLMGTMHACSPIHTNIYAHTVSASAGEVSEWRLCG